MKFPQSLPSTHQQLLEKIISVFSQDPRILGIGASGSFASDSMDKYSDLDLVIAVEPTQFDIIMKERFEIIDLVDGKLAAFTGEHVGEPRLVIALFEPNTVHVDFKFVALPDAATRIDETKVVWERESYLSDVYQHSQYHFPQPDPQWIEDRFWIWTHYAATKIARGEYFETLEFISFIRQTVLSPLALKQGGFTPFGVRKVEKYLPEFAKQLEETVAKPDPASLTKAVKKCVALYLELREKETVNTNAEAQAVVVAYLNKECGE